MPEHKKPKCDACNDMGWNEPIGPCSDGSYITSRPCPHCWVYADSLIRDKEKRRETMP